MQRVLFIANPEVDASGPQALQSWAKSMLTMMQSLNTAGWNETRLVLPNRALANDSAADCNPQVTLIDSRRFHREVSRLVKSYRVSNPTLANSARLSHRASCTEQVLREVISHAVGDFEPEIIISRAIQLPIFKELWPAATVFSLDESAFNLAPFPFSITLDDCGTHDLSFPAQHAHQLLDFASDDASSGDWICEIRAAARSAWTASNPFADCDFRQSYSQIALLPSPATDVEMAGACSGYQSYVEYLYEVMVNAPSDTGVLAIAPRSVQAALKREFPNLLCLERALQLHYPLPMLLEHCDGIWSEADDVGLQALFINKRLGSSGGGLTATIADDSCFEDFFEHLGASPENDHSNFLKWYFECYAIPFPCIEQDNWFANYLLRRSEAAATDVPEALKFPLLSDRSSLKQAWLPRADSDASLLKRTIKNRRLRKLAARQFEQQYSLAKLKVANDTPRNKLKAGERSYILGNDTANLVEGTHFGCNVVTRYIHEQMQERGFSCAGMLDTAEDGEALAQRIPLDRVDVVVINGEGSVHHDSGRIRDLFAFCQRFTQHKIPVVLINSGWHENSRVLGDLLHDFALVSVRESRSFAEIKTWRPDTTIVADLTFAALANGRKFDADAFAAINSSSDSLGGTCVIDSVNQIYTDALYSYADFHQFPFFGLGKQHFHRLITDFAIGPFEVGSQMFPQLMLDEDPMLPFSRCVTGRFHGATAALSYGIPALCTASNTPKVEGTLADIGISHQALVSERWLRLGNICRREMLEDMFSRWDERTHDAIARYCQTAVTNANELFNDIADIARPAYSYVHSLWRKLSKRAA